MREGSPTNVRRSGALDMASILSIVAGRGVGGGLLMAIVGFVRKSMATSA
jgi:hypothetical protein